MDNSIYIMLSRQQGMFRDLEISANNIANVDTAGYNSQKLNFAQYLVKNGAGKGVGATDAYADMPAAWRDTNPGSVRTTNNPFDLAIQGPGYFQVQTPLGVRYTRAGNFQINADGTLVTTQGYPVLGSDGGEIAVPENVKNVQINGGGQVTADGENLGQVGVMEFKDEQGMKRVGNTMFTTKEAPLPTETSRVVQGAVESSNVSAVSEMSHLIELQRSTTTTAKFIETMYDLQRKTSDVYTKQSS